MSHGTFTHQAPLPPLQAGVPFRKRRRSNGEIMGLSEVCESQLDWGLETFGFEIIYTDEPLFIQQFSQIPDLLKCVGRFSFTAIQERKVRKFVEQYAKLKCELEQVPIATTLREYHYLLEAE
jgi:hypothetical protein